MTNSSFQIESIANCGLTLDQTIGQQDVSFAEIRQMFKQFPCVGCTSESAHALLQLMGNTEGVVGNCQTNCGNNATVSELG